MDRIFQKRPGRLHLEFEQGEASNEAANQPLSVWRCMVEELRRFVDGKPLRWQVAREKVTRRA